MNNLFACLVHERPECVADLVRNLRHLDPDSAVLLYDGGLRRGPLDALQSDRYGVLVHPAPRPMRVGQLHGFALDCFEFAETVDAFDTVTIVDSDQLLQREGYSGFLDSRLEADAGVGLWSSSPRRQRPGATDSSTVDAALREHHLWRRLHARFGQPRLDSIHWTFWPGTIFAREARRALLELVRRDGEIRDILDQTTMWASEEVLLPTLVALLGFGIGRNPTDLSLVRWRPSIESAELPGAASASEAFWLHPVPRELNHRTRVAIRSRFDDYSPRRTLEPVERLWSPPRHLAAPLLRIMAPIEGWLEPDEAEVLIGVVAEVGEDGASPTIVEVGSHCGRATVVMAHLLRSLGSSGRIVAVDTHDGRVGASDRGILDVGPTHERFTANLRSAGVAELVESIRSRSWEVDWHDEIDLLVIDGLHDYLNVSRDFFSFEDHLRSGGLAAFHDYADYFPGVRAFVDELVGTRTYTPVARAGSMVVLRKETGRITTRTSRGTEAGRTLRRAPAATAKRMDDAVCAQPEPVPTPALVGLSQPLVSCVMATYDRRFWVARALEYFGRQDYEPRELVVIDDGPDPIEDLMPADDRIRYVRLPVRETMGAKHNLGCDVARGEIIAHWDDDDWVAPWRLSYQVEQLEAHTHAALTGLSTLWFYAPMLHRAWSYVYDVPSRPWVCGNSFCYRREWWRTHPHPSMNEGADTQLAWSLPPSEVVANPNRDYLVAIMHDHNTSPKRTHAPEYAEVPVERIEDLIGLDLAFYRSIREGRALVGSR